LKATNFPLPRSRFHIQHLLCLSQTNFWLIVLATNFFIFNYVRFDDSQYSKNLASEVVEISALVWCHLTSWETLPKLGHFLTNFFADTIAELVILRLQKSFLADYRADFVLFWSQNEW